MKIFQRYLGIVLSSLFLAGCALDSPAGGVPVSGFELSRYLGQWYEIARLDHSFERGMTDVSARFRMREDNSVEVINRYLEIKENFRL